MFSEDRYLLFGIMLWPGRGLPPAAGRRNGIVVRDRCATAWPTVSRFADLTPCTRAPLWETLSAAEQNVSRGPGWIETSLRQLFLDQPEGIFTTAELCRHVYARSRIEKKHRVAVLRALRSLARRSMPTLWRTVRRFERSDDLWFDHRAYAKRSRDSASVLARRPR